MKWIFLSHVLDSSTPLYGGNGEIQIDRVRCMTSGDTSNNSDLHLPAHSGTHIDAPRHFTKAGATLDDYPAEFWIANHPCLIECPLTPGTLVEPEALRSRLEDIPKETDCLLVRTGAEAWRSSDPDTFAKKGAGIGIAFAEWIRENRSLKFLGMDCVSTSSFAHRETGRAVHRILLGDHAASKPILLIEDMALEHLDTPPRSIVISPLRFTEADGAPVTVLAQVDSSAGDVGR